MPKSTAVLLNCLRSTARSIDLAQQSDRELLNAFVKSKDPHAFAALLRRHARLVLAACRQVLSGEADVEDAFQAAFLALHQKAPSIRSSHSLGSWLFRVARRVALAARRRNARRQVWEERAQPPAGEQPPDLSWAEVREILHDEIEKLPEQFRLPILLCYIEGQSREDAARQFGWSTSTFIGRLERGRKMLRARLVKRGVGLAAAMLAVLGESGAEASPALVQDSLRAITRGEVSLRVLGLLPQAAPAIVGKLRIGLAAVIAAALLAGAAAFTGGDKPPAPKEEAKAPAVPAAPVDAKQIKYQGTVLDDVGRPVAGAVVKHRDKQIATTDEQGRFEYATAPAEPASVDKEPIIVTAAGRCADWAARGPEAKLVFRLQPPVTVRGRLFDSEGKPIAGATLRLKSLEAEPSDDMKSIYAALEADPRRSLQVFKKNLATPTAAGLPETVRTDGEGRFEIAGLARNRVLVIVPETDGYDRAMLRVVANDTFDSDKAFAFQRRYARLTSVRLPTMYGPTFNHILKPEQLVTGVVRDAASGRPIAGVEATGAVSDGWQQDRSQARSDEQGRYRLAGMPKSAMRHLTFKPPETSAFLERSLEVADREGIGPITFDVTLPQGTVVTGRVTDKATGKPVIAEFYYSPLKENESAARLLAVSRERSMTHRLVGDADGRYRVVVPPGPGLIVALADRNRGPRGLYQTVRLRPEDRRYGFTEPEYDMDVIYIYGRNKAYPLIDLHDYRIIDPEEGARELTCDFQFSPGLTVPGRVEDPDGKPLTGVVVAGLGALWEDAVTLSGPTFTVRALAPQQRRVLAFVHPERKLFATPTVIGGDKEMVVRLQPGGTVHGRVVDKDGQPKAGIGIRVLYRDNAPDVIGSSQNSRSPGAKTDAGGRFRIEHIAPGRKFALSGILDLNTMEFLDVRGLSVESGKTRDLGDVKPGMMQ